jgi:hypothetical protein
MSYIIRVEFDAEANGVARSLSDIIGSIAPYMVDNVYIDLVKVD